MELTRGSLALLDEALERLEVGFQDLPEFEQPVDTEALRTVLMEVAERMQDNYPYPHPLYAGQMLKPPHEVARLAYALALWINPNNHGLDGGRASSAMEKEAVAQIAAMFGWKLHLGHLCGGGTIANLEAIWVSSKLRPGKKIAFSQQAHYTHRRVCELLGVPFQILPCDGYARIDLEALKALLEEDAAAIGTIVVTTGTTATGSVDPLAGILELQQEYDFRIHVDASYGGYFTLVDNLDPETRLAFDCLADVDSIALDPHKHGLQPYGCSCILFKDPTVGKLYKHDSPYTYFTSDELHLGEISLECSRAGAAAVALWATQRLLPLERGGKFAADLAQSRQAALTLFDKLQVDTRFRTALAPELDIVVWAPRADTASAISYLSREVFRLAALENVHLALVHLPVALLGNIWRDVEWDQDRVMCLRSCLIKPEHLDWIDPIWSASDSAITQALALEFAER